MSALHFHVELDGETKSWSWIADRRPDADSIRRAYLGGQNRRPSDRGRITVVRCENALCEPYREYRDHLASVPPVTF